MAMEEKQLEPDDLLEDVYDDRPTLLAGTSQHIQKIFSKIQKRDANKVDFWSAEGVRAWCDVTTGLSADTLDKCLALLHQNEIDDIRLFQGLSRNAFEKFLGPYPQFAYPMYASAQLFKAWIRDPTAKAHKASCPSQSASASASARAAAASPSAARGGHAAVGKSAGSHHHKSKRPGSDDLKAKHRKKKPRTSDSDPTPATDFMEEDDGHDVTMSSTPSPASEPRHRKKSTTPTSARVGAKSSRIFRSSTRPSGSSTKRGSSSGGSSGGRAAAAIAAARIRKSSGIEETSTGPSAALVKIKKHAKAVKPVKTHQQKGGSAVQSTAAASSSSSSSSSARRAKCTDDLIDAIKAIRGNDRLKPTSLLVVHAMPTTDAPLTHTSAFEVLLTILARKGESAVVLRALLTRFWRLIQNEKPLVAKTHALTLRDMGVGDALAAAVENQLKSSKKHDKASEVLLIALQTAALLLDATKGVKREAKLCEAVQKAFRVLPRSASVYEAGLPVVSELAACVDNARAMVDAKINVELAHALTVLKSGKQDLLIYVASAVSQLGDFASSGKIEVDLDQLGGDGLCEKLVKAMSELPLGMDLEKLRQCLGVIMVLCRRDLNTVRVGKAGGCRLVTWWLREYLERVNDGSLVKADDDVELLVLAVRNLAGNCPENQDTLGKEGVCNHLLQLVTKRDETNNELVSTTDSVSMVKEVIACIGSLTEHSNETRSRFGAAGVISWIIKLIPSSNEPWFRDPALLALSSLALLPDAEYVNVERIIAAGGCDAIMDALDDNQPDHVVDAGCQALGALPMRPTSAALLGSRACQILTKAVQRFPGNYLIVSEALQAMKAMLQHVQGREEVLKTLCDGAPEAVKAALVALTPVKDEEGGTEEGGNGEGEVKEDGGREDAQEKERKLLELKEKARELAELKEKARELLGLLGEPVQVKTETA